MTAFYNASFFIGCTTNVLNNDFLSLDKIVIIPTPSPKKVKGKSYKVYAASDFQTGGSKHGRRSFGIFYEDCYAHFVCNTCLQLLTKFHDVLSRTA